MNRDYPARDRERRSLIGPFSRAVRAASRRPGSAAGLPALPQRLVPAPGATYDARGMLEIGYERVGLLGGWSETVAPSSGRCGHSYPGHQRPANVLPSDVHLRS